MESTRACHTGSRDDAVKRKKRTPQGVKVQTEGRKVNRPYSQRGKTVINLPTQVNTGYGIFVRGDGVALWEKQLEGKRKIGGGSANSGGVVMQTFWRGTICRRTLYLKGIIQLRKSRVVRVKKGHEVREERGKPEKKRRISLTLRGKKNGLGKDKQRTKQGERRIEDISMAGVNVTQSRRGRQRRK